METTVAKPELRIGKLEGQLFFGGRIYRTVEGLEDATALLAMLDTTGPIKFAFTSDGNPVYDLRIDQKTTMYVNDAEREELRKALVRHVASLKRKKGER